MRRNFHIHKSHGGSERFSKRKLYSSLKRSGLPHHDSIQITDQVSHEIGEGTPTKDIYRKALRLVSQNSPIAGVHYSLKRAILDLGPTGLHFESFVGKYFQELGYDVETCRVFNGRWVKHEVDVIATKNHKRVFVECKFHNRVGLKNDIKIALYVKARWDDLKEGPEGKNLSSFYLVSNTAFTSDALIYSKGVGLQTLGVNAPQGRSFLEEIRALRLYPLTSLKRLNKSMKAKLLSKGIILAKEVPGQLPLLKRMGMSDQTIEDLLDEIEMLQKS